MASIFVNFRRETNLYVGKPISTSISVDFFFGFFHDFPVFFDTNQPLSDKFNQFESLLGILIYRKDRETKKGAKTKKTIVCIEPMAQKKPKTGFYRP